jgi:molybdopterin synthase catalytic subunit
MSHYTDLLDQADRKARQASELLYDMAHRVGPLTPGDDAVEYAAQTDALDRTFTRVTRLVNEAHGLYAAADRAYEEAQA